LNFRLWYENVAALLKDEDDDLFPPQFKLKIIKKDYNISVQNIVYKICIQSKKRTKYLTLSISGFKHQVLDKG